MTDSDTQSTGGLDPHRLRVGLAVAVSIGVTAGLVVALVTGGHQVFDGIRKLPLAWLALALALSVASWFLQGLGFAALTTQGVRGNLLRMTIAFLGGDFPALVTPFGSGGIPGGVFSLTREGLSAGEASAIIAMHSLLTGAFFVLFGAFAALTLPLHGSGSTALVWSGFTAILIVVGLIVWVAFRPTHATRLLGRMLASRRVARMVGRARAERLVSAAEREAELFTVAVKMLTRERPAALALSFFGLFMSRICLVVTMPVIMYGLGWRGDIVPLLATAVGAMSLSIASPTPGGSGAVEVATTALLATQAPVAIAGAATLLWRGITYYTEVLAGWIAFSRYLTMKPRTIGIADTPEK
jgi:uncharacterized protein (TIRG00374 family)